MNSRGRYQIVTDGEHDRNAFLVSLMTVDDHDLTTTVPRRPPFVSLPVTAKGVAFRQRRRHASVTTSIPNLSDYTCKRTGVRNNNVYANFGQEFPFKSLGNRQRRPTPRWDDDDETAAGLGRLRAGRADITGCLRLWQSG
ncbi:hypothetical protein EVAR_13808_1 [Eumeta japonica]|uniref:Uncharacterized protein n=1 Tax=Eumeta variegata TaxID=151549 RepID=A0A4C1U115_EUMVA|nr:hypothetical protein EVAR_13808_1 [Eumeta japonica]